MIYDESVWFAVFVISAIFAAIPLLNAIINLWINFLYSHPAATRRKILNRIYFGMISVCSLLACFSAYMLWGA